MKFAPLPPISECSAALRAGRLSIPALIDACLTAITAGNSTLRALVAIDGAQARSDAEALQQQLDHGHDCGPLHGIPIVVKDTIRVAGLPTGYGSRSIVEATPDRDATVVARLRAAGAIILGKATTWELGCGVGEIQTENPYPEARNPIDQDYFTGGSSSGSAVAVAAGFACGAIGGDTGGSIRSPASACGIVGLKPTFGVLDREGAFAHSLSLDHLGTFAADPNGAGLIFEAMAGVPPSSPRDYADCSTLRFGLLTECLTVGAPGMLRRPALVDAILTRLALVRADVSPVSLGAEPAAWREIMEIIGGYESYRQNAHLLQPGITMSPAVRNWLSRSARLTFHRYQNALARREQLCARLQRAFDGADILLSPTALHPLPPRADEAACMRFSTDSSLAVFNLSGHPAMSIPVGLDAAGLPLGLQLTARRGAERTLTDAGTWLMKEFQSGAVSPACPDRNLLEVRA